jgi:hypothetical protein
MKTIKFTATLVIASLLTVACNNAGSKEPETKEGETENKAEEKGFSVEGKALVFIRPDSITFEKAIEKVKKERGEDALAEIGSDEGLYAGEAKDYVTSKGLKVFDSDAKLILFKKEDGSVFRMENKVEGLGADVYLFDGKKDPKKIESLAAFGDEKEYNAYFGIADLNPIIKQLQGKWAPVSDNEIHTENYESDLVIMMPNQQYLVKVEGEYLVYTPHKNVTGGAFKRKLKKVTEKEFTYYEEGDKTLSKLVRPK